MRGGQLVLLTAVGVAWLFLPVLVDMATPNDLVAIVCLVIWASASSAGMSEWPNVRPSTKFARGCAGVAAKGKPGASVTLGFGKASSGCVMGVVVPTPSESAWMSSLTVMSST